MITVALRIKKKTVNKECGFTMPCSDNATLEYDGYKQAKIDGNR